MTRVSILTLVAGSLLLASQARAGDAFDVTLGPCNTVLCGADSTALLREGQVQVGDGGSVEVEIDHATLGGSLLAATTLTVCFEPIGGAATAVGDLVTDAEGSFGEDGEDRIGTLDVRSEMGLFLLVDGDCTAGTKLFVTMFSTDGSGDDDDGRSSSKIEEHPEDDNDRDGLLNDDDPDDDNDGILDVDDPDDDNDGIPDVDDADPDDANRFDDAASQQELKDAFKGEKRALKSTSKEELRRKRDDLKRSKKLLKEDFRDRKDDF